jgi:Outer membrane protein beta-barrel domain
LRVNLVLVRAGLLGLLLVLLPSVASADWLFAPFVGGAFGGSTALLDLEQGASSTQIIFGGSAGWWSPGLIGFESDLSYAPRFFERDNLAGLVTDSNMLTWGGNVVVAMPVSVTRESLRPYVLGGLGWIHTSIDEGSNVFPEFLGRARNSVGMNFGGGAIGFISPRTGFRFEVRHFRSLERAEDPVTLENTSLLSFWRATVGVVIRR